MWTDAGSVLSSRAIRALTSEATCTVFVPGCRCTASTMARWPLNHDATLLFCTSSLTVPRSLSLTGAPLRVATTTLPKSAALRS